MFIILGRGRHFKISGFGMSTRYYVKTNRGNSLAKQERFLRLWKHLNYDYKKVIFKVKQDEELRTIFAEGVEFTLNVLGSYLLI